MCLIFVERQSYQPKTPCFMQQGPNTSKAPVEVDLLSVSLVGYGVELITCNTVVH